jgi:hypothetical protein
MAETPKPDPHADEIARQANGHIHEMAEALESIVADERPIAFFCECGCMGIAELTLAEYASAGGAWRKGHR